MRAFFDSIHHHLCGKEGREELQRDGFLAEQATTSAARRELLQRGEPKNRYEYEEKWLYKPIEATVWVERDTMLAMGKLL